MFCYAIESKARKWGIFFILNSSPFSVHLTSLLPVFFFFPSPSSFHQVCSFLLHRTLRRWVIRHAVEVECEGAIAVAVTEEGGVRRAGSGTGVWLAVPNVVMDGAAVELAGRMRCEGVCV